ncbi:MAG: twin-arginine translocase TatA/TatE family subunit [Candidatus Thioglobus autotrophicus]|jgi:sec-independent protein translocase protein TatA|nr:twin-arginine translocase TatA/TatE family subunit [Candidatus Thioglobus autotrophicus]
MPGPFELVIILAIVILIFGAKRLKNLGSDLGGAIKGFKSSVKDAETEEEETIEIEVEQIDNHEEAEIETSDDTSEKSSEKITPKENNN